MTKIGLDQIGIPAPLLYRRICNAYIIFIAPALAAFVAYLPLDIVWKHVLTGGLVGLSTIVKSLEYIIGDSSLQNSQTQTPK